MNAVGRRIWVEDEEFIFLPGKIIGQETDKIKVEVWLNSKKQIRLVESSRDIIEAQDLFCPDDLSTLKDINQAYLLYILRRRFEMNNCLTLIGKHLALWVNQYNTTKPFKLNENDANLISEFCTCVIKEEAKRKNLNLSLSQSQSFTQCQTHNNISEAIVLHGQTMSGKTILSTIIVNTLLEMSNDPPSINPLITNCKEMISQSLQIIKLFNQCGQSSKSCLLINLNYDMAYENITSCKFIPFILLSNSLTSNDQTGVFNIFNMLIETMDDKHRQIFFHKPRAYFICLAKANENNNTNTHITYEQFEAFIKQLAINGEYFNVFISILMSILYFGNIQFMIDQSNKEVDINPHSKEDMKAISILLSIDYNELKKVFIQCKTTSEASLLRNKIVHLLYSKATDWLFNQINHYFNEKDKEYSIQFSHYLEKKKTVSIFDSIGYQNQTFNSIDNFIINYSNEKIIELFNKKMLSIEQDEYKRESIQWRDIDYFDNSEVLKLFESKGLIDLLDESSSSSLSLPHHSIDDDKNKSFYTKVYQSYSNSRALGIKCNDFISINHSFGDIHYYANGFIDKNIKVIPKEVSHCFESSRKYFINQILNYNKTSNTESLIKLYRKKIDEFITILSHSNLKFIRCFNSNSTPNLDFSSSIVYSQITTSNIPLVFSFIKRKFNCKMTFDSFIRKYGFISKDILDLIRRACNLSNKESPAIKKWHQKTSINCKGIIIEMISLLKRNKKLKQSLSNNNIQIGLTIIYLDDTALNGLDDIMKNITYIKILQRNAMKVIRLRYFAKKIQRVYRAFHKRKRQEINEAKQKKESGARVKSLSAQKVRHNKNVLDILKEEQSNLIETELLQMVKNYQEEINLLREVHIENEELKKKNASLQLQVASIENENENEKGKTKERESASAFAPRNSTSKSALALLTEISALKKKIKEYEIKLETQIISIQQSDHIILDLRKLNEALQDQISKRSQNDLKELNLLMERITTIENEKKEYEERLNALNGDIDYISMGFSGRNLNENKDQSKGIAEYKKILLSTKAEIKQSKTAYNELKVAYGIEVTKTKALAEKLSQQESKTKNAGGIGIGWAKETRFTISNLPNKQQQKDLKSKDKEIALLKDELAICRENQEKKNETYQNQLMIKSQELKNRQEYITQLHNSLDMHMENSIQRRKEIFNTKNNKEMILASPLIQNEAEVIKKKDEEINQLRELVKERQKLYEDSCIEIKHKRRVIQKKKEENDLLVILFKNKKSELQCVEALKYANSTSIKEKLLRVQDQEKELIEKIEELANDIEGSDDDDSEDNKDKEDKGENNRSFEVGSIESSHSNNEQ